MGQPAMDVEFRIALAVVIVLATAATASAAKSAGKSPHRQVSQARLVAPQSPGYIDSDSPGVAGGGSLGYNRNIYQDDW
jgi:hypothetical protein